MDKVELLLPAGDRDSLRAAVANGADAVYLGLDSFNARSFAENFRRETLPGVVRFCHGKRVKVFVTANILVKNHELEDYLGLVRDIDRSGADAAIIQDPWLIPLVREAAPGCEVHLSTQSTTLNRYAVPEGVNRVIAPRELALGEISELAKAIPVEMFVHGALCLSYSGQCLFSSIAGGRSGNRGRCAQPCRQQYNGKYPLSTRDLCLLEKLPEIIGTGVAALKVEGRMRGPLYVGTVARIYRKYIDMHYSGEFAVDPKDMDDLRMAFNRDFTTGFAFNKSIVDASASTNRGIYLGRLERGSLRLESCLRAGDGVMVLEGGRRSGNIVSRMIRDGESVEVAEAGDVVKIDVKGAKDGNRIYRNMASDLKVDLGQELALEETDMPASRMKVPKAGEERAPGPPALFVSVHTPEAAGEADRAGAAVVYYDMFSRELEVARNMKGKSKFFLSAPRIMSGREVEKALDIVREVRPDGVLVGERGLLAAMGRERIPADIHLNQSLNIFNDIDLGACGGIPIISPELSFDDIAAFRSRRLIVPAHGPIVLMTTREPVKDTVLRDGSDRRFRARKNGDVTEILNCSDLGLFNLTRKYLDAGVRWFHLDLERDVGKFVKAYMRIISGERFDDSKIRRGFTTGHFRRGVA
ncbi:MAG: U32 family peptidase [Thermoplasmata archaeon]